MLCTDLYRKKRDELYRQAMQSRSNKVLGAAGFYASEARAQNKLFKVVRHIYNRQIDR